MKTTLLIFTLVLGTALTAQAKVVEREGTTTLSKSGSGTNVGGGNNGSEYLATWCRGQSSLLRNYKDRARLKLDNTGDYNIANKLLTDGIVQALNNSTNASETFLHKSLVRGLTISNYLGASLGGNPERKAMAANNILNSYYDFMLETVAKNLDLNGKIPYMSSSDADMDQRAAHFEENFVIYANTQLNWILGNLVKEVRMGDRVQVVPVGDARSVIKVALALSTGTASDLEESLWNYRFSCTISDLQMLNDSLKAYDQGNKEMFEDEKQALEYTTKELRRISRTLTLRESCQ
ncbi:MAG: hypothetical protein H7177_15625 [Rhizobacter sp.]|nr:hypothetical protein [Bacteriovorax sp.]